MESRISRQRRSGVRQKLGSATSYNRESQQPQVTYSGSPTVEYDGNIINFRQSPTKNQSSSRSTTPSPRMTTELKLWSDRDRSASSRNSSFTSELMSVEDQETFQINSRPTPQEIIFTVPYIDQNQSWRMTETAPRRKGILMGTNIYEKNQSIGRRQSYGGKREITQWDIASDSGISENMGSWDLAETGGYAVSDYNSEPVEFIISMPQPSRTEKVSTLETYNSIPWHVQRLHETHTPMELLYPERINSPVGYKRYLTMSTPTLPDRQHDLTQEIDLIRINDTVQIRKRHESHGLENGMIKTTFEEDSSMDPCRYEPYIYQDASELNSQYIDIRPKSPLPIYSAPVYPAPIWRSLPTILPPPPQEEPYHEDSWVVYHSVPCYIPQQQYEIPEVLPYQNYSVQNKVDIVREARTPVVQKVFYDDRSNLSDRKQNVTFVEETDYPDDYFYYQYQTPKKKRIVDKVKVESNSSQVVVSRSQTDYKGFPESLQILLRRYAMLKQKNSGQRVKDITMFPISGSLKETINIDEDEKEVGDMSMVFDVHEKEKDIYSETFNTVNEKVNLDVDEKKAIVLVKIQYELYTPLDLATMRWLRKRVIVTRVITLDLRASQETRKIFNDLMQRSLPDVDWSLSSAIRVSGSDAFRVYNSLMAIVEEEEEKMDPTSKDTIGLDTIPQYIEAGYDQFCDSALSY